MESLINYPNGSLRRFERKSHMRTIGFSLNFHELDQQKKLDLNGKTINISKEGICIQTDYPLTPGNTLLFNGGIDREGIVRWCMKVDDIYRAGVQLETNRDYVEYLEKKIGDDLLFVSEKREKYTGLLDEAVKNFNEQLKDLEKRCFNPGENPDELLNAVTKTLIDMRDVCEEFERGVDYDKTIIKNAQINFRVKTDSIMSKSYLINRTRTWPQGHQGDYKTLEFAYRNTPMSDGIGYYLDKYMLSTTIAVAAKERIIKLRELLKEELINRQNPNVLDIACGSCREVLELATDIHKSGAKFTCIDLDSDALNFALSRLSYSGLSSKQVKFFRYNALRMFDHELNMEEFGMQDIIYSVGFFDYLTDDFLVKMLNALYMLLNPGGILLAAFKDADRYKAQDYHWFVDWDGFRQRTIDDFNRLINQAGIPDAALSTSRVESGVIIFYTVTKERTLARGLPTLLA